MNPYCSLLLTLYVCLFLFIGCGSMDENQPADNGLIILTEPLEITGANVRDGAKDVDPDLLNTAAIQITLGLIYFSTITPVATGFQAFENYCLPLSRFFRLIPNNARATFSGVSGMDSAFRLERVGRGLVPRFFFSSITKSSNIRG